MGINYRYTAIPIGPEILSWYDGRTRVQCRSAERVTSRFHQWISLQADSTWPLQTMPSPSSLPHPPSIQSMSQQLKYWVQSTLSKESFTHLDVREEALILKKVAFTWLATHLPAKDGVTCWGKCTAMLESPTNECLAGTRRPKQKDPFWRPPQTFEYVPIIQTMSCKSLSININTQ